MRSLVPLRLLLALAAVAAAAPAEIIDRIAVSVANSAITVSDVEREVRVTAFLNGVRADLGAASKRAAADRMVEQRLIRRELELSRYPAPDASTVNSELEDFRKAHYQTDTAFQSALAGAGITEQEVKDELLWQLTLLRFIEVRFRPGVQVSDQEIQDYFEKAVRPAAQAAHPSENVTLEDYRDDIEETLAGQRADMELDNWLKEARQRTEIVYHPEALQ